MVIRKTKIWDDRDREAIGAVTYWQNGRAILNHTTIIHV